MWVKHANDEMTARVVHNVKVYLEQRNPSPDPHTLLDTEVYIQSQVAEAEQLQTRNSVIQLGLNLISLVIMFSLYRVMARREKEMELQKVKAEESNRAKSTFLSNMSHDIRTPMNAIIGYINIAERDENDPEKIREYLGKIKISSHQLLALINDVLEMSRIESGKMGLEPVLIDLKKTVCEVGDMFSAQMEQKNITFTVDTSRAKKSLVMCDKNRLNRVLLNLISNAWKYTPEGGTVDVILSEKDAEEAGFGDFELRVADSGIGMSKEFADKVFEAFEREHKTEESGIEGTGLGMSITKSIVDLMGGSIYLNTAPNKGTEFVVDLRLPLYQEDEVPGEAEPQKEEAKKKLSSDFASMRLLIVEDMDINREIATMQIKSLGFAIETAVNGKEALDLVKEKPEGYYDVILMDIQMPVMDGYRSTEEIRKLEGKRGKVPIIALTANAFSEDVKKSADVGMNAHISKPIDMNVMQNVLNDVLG
jgi:signal transduction histidine kinase/ActR/RegA family two-component response regulator